MSKKEFLKRMGQLYAEAIQCGYKPEQVYEYSETVIKAFIIPKKNEFFSKEKNEEG